jgi:hypothetical protein
VFAEEVGEGHVGAGVIFEAEGGGFVAGFEHESPGFDWKKLAGRDRP